MTRRLTPLALASALVVASSCGTADVRSSEEPAAPADLAETMLCVVALDAHRAEDVEGIVVLESAATEEAVAGVRSVLRDEGFRIDTVTPEESYRVFVEVFADDPGLLDATSAEDLPWSLRITIDEPPLEVSSPVVDRLLAMEAMVAVHGVGHPGPICEGPAGEAALDRLVGGVWGSTDVVVFVSPESLAEQPEIERALVSMEEVSGILYYSQAAAYEEFACMFEDSPELVSTVEPGILPPSFRLEVGDDPEVLDDLVERAKALPGVREAVRAPAVGSPIPWDTLRDERRSRCAGQGERLR